MGAEADFFTLYRNGWTGDGLYVHGAIVIAGFGATYLGDGRGFVCSELAVDVGSSEVGGRGGVWLK